jgi:hypothetical protein
VAARGACAAADPHTKRARSATAGALNATLQATANKLDRDNDVLFLILTSHGSHDGLAVVAGRLNQILTPAALGGMLDRTGINHKVIVISACYSGIFIPRPLRGAGHGHRGLRTVAAFYLQRVRTASASVCSAASALALRSSL